MDMNQISKDANQVFQEPNQASADSKQIVKLAEELDLPDQVRGLIEEQAAVLPMEEYSSLIGELTEPDRAENAQKRLAVLVKSREGDTGMAQLTVMLAAALCTREKYTKSQIPDPVFLDTMGCFSRFLRETRANTGEWVFDRAFWTWRQTSGRLFRLGTLEFEYCQAREVIPGDFFHKEDMALSVHIPSDAVLTEEALADAYQKMDRFFAEYADAVCYAGRPETVLCSSWLLSPELYRMLDPDSGIRRFASDYERMEVDPDQEDCFQWLFEGVEDFRLLPEKTSLQRTVKKHLQNGGKIGIAAGRLKKWNREA